MDNWLRWTIDWEWQLNLITDNWQLRLTIDWDQQSTEIDNQLRSTIDWDQHSSEINNQLRTSCFVWASFQKCKLLHRRWNSHINVRTNDTSGSTLESSSSWDWVEGEWSHQEFLRLEIGNGTWETGNRTWDLGYWRWEIDLSLMIMSVSWWRGIICLLSALKSFGWWVGGWWCSEIITSALLLLFLNWDLERWV